MSSANRPIEATLNVRNDDDNHDENSGVPSVMSDGSGAMWYRNCISNSWNLSVDQNRSSFDCSRWKNLTYKYSLKIGPIAPAGGQLICSSSRGIIGFPTVTARFTCTTTAHERGSKRFATRLAVMPITVQLQQVVRHNKLFFTFRAPKDWGQFFFVHTFLSNKTERETGIFAWWHYLLPSPEVIVYGLHKPTSEVSQYSEILVEQWVTSLLQLGDSA